MHAKEMKRCWTFTHPTKGTLRRRKRPRLLDNLANASSVNQVVAPQLFGLSQPHGGEADAADIAQGLLDVGVGGIVELSRNLKQASNIVSCGQSLPSTSTRRGNVKM